MGFKVGPALPRLVIYLCCYWGCFMCLMNVGERHDPEKNNDLCDTRFLTQNCRGLNNSLKRNKVFNNFKDKADIIFVQESHSTKATEVSWKKCGEERLFFLMERQHREAA